MLSPSIEALTWGNSRSAWIAARKMNGRYVSLTPFFSRKASLCFAPEPGDVGVVHLEHGRHVRRGALREDHVLGRDPPDLGHRDDFVAVRDGDRRTRRGRRRRFGGLGAARDLRGSGGRTSRARARDLAVLEVGENVVLGDPVVNARALDLADLDRVLLGDLADEGRGTPSNPLLDRFDLAAARRLVGRGGRQIRGGRRTARGGGGGRGRGRRGSCGRRRRRNRLRFGFRGGWGRLRSRGSRGRCFGGSSRSRGCSRRRGGSGRRGSSGSRGSRRCFGRGSAFGGRLFTGLADHAHDRVDRHGRAFGGLDFEERAGHGGRDLGVHLVRRDLEDGLVAFDGVADLLEPLRDGPLGDRFPHLGHDDFGRHKLLSVLPVVSPGRGRSWRPLDPGPPNGE